MGRGGDGGPAMKGSGQGRKEAVPNPTENGQAVPGLRACEDQPVWGEGCAH